MVHLTRLHNPYTLRSPKEKVGATCVRLR
jgi:hypothetical protein